MGLNGLDERFAAVAADGGNGEKSVDVAIARQQGVDARLAFVGGNQVEFVEYQPAGFVEQRFVLAAQFVDDGVGVANGVGVFVARGEVHNG